VSSVADVVTGEAVALDLRAAQLPSRALAFVIDVVVQAVLLVVLVWIYGAVLPDIDEAMASAVLIGTLVLVVVVWPVAWETLSHGRSLGKMAMGLRVVRDDGGPVRFRQALVRALVGFFADFWTTFGCGALFSSLFSKKNKRLGDMAAGTFVLRERTGGGRGVPFIPLHPAASAWAAELDLSGLRDDLALAARQFLARAPQLDQGVAASLGERMAMDVAAKIGAPPPPGMHPGVFLAAVLAERGRREMMRAQQQVPQMPLRPQTQESYVQPSYQEQPPPKSDGGFSAPL
jgi:uncharacterized RDD family membrane protein YckC